MQNLGVDKLFIDKSTGTRADRQGLQDMLSFVRDGDCVIVESISRMARNTMDLLEILDKLNKKNVQFISQKENIDTKTPVGMFMLQVFGAVAELENTYRKLRTREGIDIAKEQGKFKGRQKIELNEKKFEKVYTDWKKGNITAKKAMELLGLKANTFYRRVKEFEEKTLNQ